MMDINTHFFILIFFMVSPVTNYLGQHRYPVTKCFTLDACFNEIIPGMSHFLSNNLPYWWVTLAFRVKKWHAFLYYLKKCNLNIQPDL
jgi:hypothetical protein